jgi:hypothetical protein
LIDDAAPNAAGSELYRLAAQIYPVFVEQRWSHFVGQVSGKVKLQLVV